jgi:hypothetical protein
MGCHPPVVGFFVSRKRGAQHANQYLAVAGVEFDDPAFRATDVEREYLQAFFAQDVLCPLAILCADCRPRRRSSKDRHHVRPAEHFDLHLTAPRAKHFESPDQIADREIDIAVAFLTPDCRGAGGHDAMAERTQLEARAPERHPDARAENGLQQAGLAHQLHFSGVQVKLGQFIYDGGSPPSCRLQEQSRPGAHPCGSGSPSDQ